MALATGDGLPGPAAEHTDPGLAGPEDWAGRSDIRLLADRLAAVFVHHEPGWRLPRPTAIARRYNVSVGGINAALDQLVYRQLVCRRSDGQLYRASPAEYLIRLASAAPLVLYLDPVGGELACRSRQVSRRKVPEDIGRVLRAGSAAAVLVVRFLWTTGARPAALCTTYLPKDLAGRFTGAFAHVPGTLRVLPLTARPDMPEAERLELVPLGRPGALRVEMQPPLPSAARDLRLPPGQLAARVSVRFDDPVTSRPVALTVVMLRAEEFRIVVKCGQPSLPEGDGGGAGSHCGAWSHGAQETE